MVDFLKEFNERVKKLKYESRPCLIQSDSKRYNLVVTYGGDRKAVAFNLSLREAELLAADQRRRAVLKGKEDKVFDIQYDTWEEL